MRVAAGWDPFPPCRATRQGARCRRRLPLRVPCRGSARPESDTDVAVLLDDGADADRRQLELAATLGDDVDVVVLNDAPVALAYRVLSHGILLVCRDDRARVRHWARTVDRYLDSAPLRRSLEAGQRHRLREGRFGRP